VRRNELVGVALQPGVLGTVASKAVGGHHAQAGQLGQLQEALVRIADHVDEPTVSPAGQSAPLVGWQ